MVELNFEEIVDKHYTMLYRFAITLTHNEANACDLTQQTFTSIPQKSSKNLENQGVLAL
ncbi:hypothetical protein N8766_01025 [bacterium]|nr:hypothetical protein [bacterium]